MKYSNHYDFSLTKVKDKTLPAKMRLTRGRTESEKS